MGAVENHDPSPEFERFRPYLLILAQIHMDRKIRTKVSASDVVQDTLLEVYRDSHRFRGKEIGQQIAWIKKILIHNLCNTARDYHREKRDIDRELSLEMALERSSTALEKALADSGTTPDERAGRTELLLQVAEILQALPDGQREAIILHYLEGLPLPEIAERLERTTVSAAGLVRRGLGRLRRLLRERAT